MFDGDGVCAGGRLYATSGVPRGTAGHGRLYRYHVHLFHGPETGKMFSLFLFSILHVYKQYALQMCDFELYMYCVEKHIICDTLLP